MTRDEDFMRGDSGGLADVTRKLEAQARLFEGILSSISDLAYAFDTEARVLYANHALLEVWGRTLDEVVGKTLFELDYPEALAARLHAELLEVLASGRQVKGEVEFQAASGSVDYHEYMFNPVFGSDGKVVSVAGLTRLITERKAQEAELQRRERIYRAIGESIDFGIWICEADGRNRYVSDSLLKLLGTTFEQLADFTWKDLLHPDDAEATIEAWKECARNGSFWEREHRFLGADGKYHPTLARGVPIRDESGRVEAWAGINLDIARFKKAEEALRDSEAHMRSIFQQAGAGIAQIDLNGRIVLMNDAFCRLTGRSREALNQLRLQDITHPDDWPENERQIKALATGTPSFVIEKRYVRPDGGIVWVRNSKVGIRDADGSFVGVLAIVQEITESKQHEAALKQAKEAAEAANRAKDHFLAVLSHELRTPLTPVLMTVAALEADGELSHDLREDLAMIRRNVELETKLIDDLLDLSRVTSGKLRLRMELVHLNEAVRHACGICRPQMMEKGVQLRLSLDESVGQVYADPARLQQVFWNVLKNAAKFTPEGGFVDVSTSAGPKGFWRLEVSDNGIGIPKEVLPRIFDAFEQGDEASMRQFGGLGLGLAISKALVEMHYGSIQADSPGRGLGSVFTIDLPSEPHSAESASPAPTEAGGASTSRGRLLVAEDHVDTIRVLSRLLRRAGYTVTTATSVAEALAVAADQPFDLLLTDLGLPDATGHELMKRLNERKPIKGIAMSGYGMDEDLRRSREAGFLDHLVKPVDTELLLQAIRRALAQSSA